MSRKAVIQSDSAVRAALELIDEHGVGAFSVERLSRKLGVRGPSLYYHFDDRADLLAHVAKLILTEVPDPFAEHPDGDWEDLLVQFTVGFRRVMVRHPNAAPVLLEHFPRGSLQEVYERNMTQLDGEGIADDVHVLLLAGLEQLALGSALAHCDEAMLALDVDADEHPALARSLAAAEGDAETRFGQMCRAYIRGLRGMLID